MSKNPFKFGSIVDDPHFTDREKEISRVMSLLNSDNHLIIISPRRFGKSSLIFKVVKQTIRPVISIDFQIITTVEDFAAQLLKRIYRIYHFEKVKQIVRNFRIIPTISINPVNNEVDISFQPVSAQLPMLEDVMNLMEKLSNERKKLIVVMDEFQEAPRINPDLLNHLRSIIQHHKHINYVFLGSQESLMREIFEKKKSPFYHFGMLMPLGKIPREDFKAYLIKGLHTVTRNNVLLSEEILNITNCHPYYTQQLAFVVWNILNQKSVSDIPVRQAINELIRMHDMDYEILWNTFNRTDKKVLIGLSLSGLTPLMEAFFRKYNIGAPSTAYSSLKRLLRNGYIVKNDNKYEIDDPFLSLWIKERREQ
ncbi:MAG: ATP-binding protein [Bacteroidales bacterium]|nr:ATP-binding protein [Bacteroidales bacterium]